MTTRCAACNCGKLEIVCEGEPVRTSIVPLPRVSASDRSCLRRSQRGSPNSKRPSPATQPNSLANPDAGRSVSFRFCPVCGSTVYWEAEAFPGHIAASRGVIC